MRKAGKRLKKVKRSATKEKKNAAPFERSAAFCVGFRKKTCKLANVANDGEARGYATVSTPSAEPVSERERRERPLETSNSF